VLVATLAQDQYDGGLEVGLRMASKGPFGFEGYINTSIDILNFNSRVFEYRYLNTRRP
jgi:hypothetical protein